MALASLLKKEDPITRLKQDHKKVSTLFKKLLSKKEPSLSQRKELFKELNTELTAHAEVEEKVFYPALKTAKQTHGLILESYEEHHLVKFTLKELDEERKDTEEWKAKLIVLQENIDHHVKEEEQDLFIKANRILDSEEKIELGKKMKIMKEKLLI
jgi:iron-sulfur cluster repair protein YtfE (RIC family)